MWCFLDHTFLVIVFLELCWGFLRGSHCFVFIVFVFVCSLPVSLFLCLLLCLWCLDFLRSILSPTGLRSVSDEIDLKNQCITKQQQTKNKDTGKEHKQKKQKKAKQWPHLSNPQHSSRNTIPRNVWSRKHHTAYVIWSFWTPKRSAVHCELSYLKIVLNKTRSGSKV